MGGTMQGNNTSGDIGTHLLSLWNLQTCDISLWLYNLMLTAPLEITYIEM